jgi:membrane fusion protein (multidrug efflux system)
MKAIPYVIGCLILGVLGWGVWVLLKHPEWVKGKQADVEDEVEVPPVVSVQMGKITRATLRRYVEGYGTVEPQPAQEGAVAASARVASPVAGLLAEVRCVQGERVEKGALLFQLDERSARAEEEKAQATVLSAKASLDRLRAFPRPDQIKVAEMQVERTRRSVEYSQKKNARLQKLVADELASEKTLQEAELELLGAQNDLAVAEKQLLLLRSSPTPEEIAEAQGKVVEAEKALAGAQVQRSILKIRSPLAGTVVRVKVNPGEAVDLSTVLAEVVDLDRLDVEGTIPSSGLRSVKTGLEVELRPGAQALRRPGAAPAPDQNPSAAPAPAPGETRLAGIRGKVLFVGLDVDRKSDSAFVRVSLPAKAGLLPGQFVRFRIVVEEHANHLVVPQESVVITPEGKSVIVGLLGEKAVQTEVQVGLREGGLVEVEGEDLKEGQPVVTRGAYGLPDEARIRLEGKKEPGAPSKTQEPH